MREFTRETTIKATRKPHACWCCHTLIEAGSPAKHFAQKYDGDFHSGHMHPDCRSAEVAWNDLMDTWGEDWNPLDTIKDSDDAEYNCAWLAEKFPAVAARLGIPAYA